ncbi:MAG TPA: adenylyl cyclase [Lapillicoccus sp.]|nr:adenylyl cyclase [Lapillicoccus sp.]
MSSPRSLAARCLLAAAVALGGLSVATVPAHAAGDPDLGPNVVVFDDSMPLADVQATLDAAAAQQVDDEMGTGRKAFLFKPGTYGTAEHPLQFRVGYYTEVAGLGRDPGDVVVNGKIEVYNRCLGDGGTSNCIALNNFWRSLSNLHLQVNGLGQDGCRQSANFWAVSQAAPMRRVRVTGANLSLMDYCTAGPQYASGGFVADSQLPFTINGSQQQWLTRNSSVEGWSNGVWNQVFAGVEGAPDDTAFPNPPYTTLETTPVSREKPYLYVDDDGAWNVLVPDAQNGSRGTTWSGGSTPGRSVPLSDFYVARPGDTAKSLNKQVSMGKNLLLTPGVYDVDKPVEVKRPDSVVLGLGLATLTAQNGSVAVRVRDTEGVSLAGFMVDAGARNSPVLMQVGPPDAVGGSADNPTTLSDVFFRVGGPHAGKATTTLEVNSDHVLLDHIWAWRADHGNPGGYGWTTSTGRNGVVVNGDDVTATGFFVEHYQQYNVIWRGERGRTVMFQNELPYDPPDQAAYQHDGVLGWAAYKIADDVTDHELWGGGSYVFFNVDPSIHATRGFEVPVTDGVRLHRVMTVNLSAGTIDHVVNDTGGAASTEVIGVPQNVVEFP